MLLLRTLLTLILLVNVVQALIFLEPGRIKDERILTVFEEVKKKGLTYVKNTPLYYKPNSIPGSAAYATGNVITISGIVALPDSFSTTDRASLSELDTFAHEYGHVIQHSLGALNGRDSAVTEVEATALGTLSLLRLGFTREELKAFYNDRADNSKGVHSPEIGHPDVEQEYRDCANNVDRININATGLKDLFN